MTKQKLFLCLLLLPLACLSRKRDNIEEEPSPRVAPEMGVGLILMGGGTCKRFTDADISAGIIKCEDLDKLRSGGCCPSKKVASLTYCKDMRLEKSVPKVCKKYPKEISCQTDAGKWETRETGIYQCAP